MERAGKKPGDKRKKDPLWINSEAKKLVVQDMIDGIVPYDQEIVDTKKLYDDLYKGHPAFEDWPYDHKRFSGKAGRFASCQRTVKRYKDSAAADQDALDHDMALKRAKGPPTTVNKQGETLWRDSEADHYLEIDMLAGRHLEMAPQDLKATRPCYGPISKKRFAKRIQQKKHDAKEFGKTPNQTAAGFRMKNNRSISRKMVADPYVNEADIDSD